MRPNIPTIVLVGRTNVGKSTLFNRLTETNKALVSDEAGTTRDRKEGECLWRGTIVNIVDTGGLDVAFADEIEENTVKQAELAMAKADIILFIVDTKAGPLPQERELAEKLRDGKVPVIVVGNKAETASARASLESSEWRLAGLPAPFPISAIRGSGVGDLLDMIYDNLAAQGKKPATLSQVQATRIAVIGKPNVGKSSLLNAILGEERFITSPIAHTTREPNDVLVEIGDRSFIFIDTAGMRKKGKVRKEGGLERIAVERTEHILKNTDVALFVLDAAEKIGAQERTLGGMLKDSRVGIITVVNKWDLVEDKTPSTLNQFRKIVEASLPFLTWAPMIFISALKKQRVKNIFDEVDRVQANRYTEIPEKKLNDFLKSAIKKHKPSKGKGPKAPSVISMKQVGVAPPSFLLYIRARQTDELHPSYLRFLENRLREQFSLEGTPIRIGIRRAQSTAR